MTACPGCGAIGIDVTVDPCPACGLYEPRPIRSREPNTAGTAGSARLIQHDLDHDPNPPVRWYHWLTVLAVGVISGLMAYLVLR